MPETLKITGGTRLQGEVTPVPNKNAILSAFPASLLTDQTVTYHNIPATTDVKKFLEILSLLGADIDDSDYTNLKINTKNINSYKVDLELGNQIRASIMLAGPLLARFGIAEIPTPGGCVLGKRSIMAHIDTFSKAGIKFEMIDGYARFTVPKNLEGKYDIWQFEASETGTENIFLYSAGTESEFCITDAASEPHVSQLLKTLQNMGAEIEGIGSNKVTLKGKKNLKNFEFFPEPDFVDIGGLIVATAVTKGKVRILNANIESVIGGMVQVFEKFNIEIIKDGNDLIVNGDKDLYIDKVNSGFAMAEDDLPKLVPRPWPGFPIDVLPVMVTLACKTKGQLLIQNWMYETGLDFVRELNALGGNIFVADPQRIIVKGPVSFSGGNITSPGVIQSCKALFIATLADNVESTITGVDILKRRYPDIFEVYTKLGAKLEKIN